MLTDYEDIFSLSGWIIAAVLSGLVFLWLLPVPISTDKTVRIQRGTSVEQAARQLAQKGIILFPQLVSVPVRLRSGSVVAGEYRFPEAVNALTVANRLQSGRFRTQQLQITIPEGLTHEQIAERVASSTDISEASFLQAAAGREGRLFPDTYTLYPDTSAGELVKQMQENFRAQIQKLQPQLDNFPYNREEIITMASLVAREAADYGTQRRVAGVLWKRLEKSMPLQVDATFFYLAGKASHEITKDDLATSSPYNLYENTGLPPTPIANPGLEAIRATINPIRTDDLYYLTGDDGNFYFSETLEEHQRNKRSYLGS